MTIADNSQIVITPASTLGIRCLPVRGETWYYVQLAVNAVWVSWRGIRDDGYDAIECTIFRNESNQLSSDLIRYAVTATKEIWGWMKPKDGLITYVAPKKIKSRNPGYCFKMAGFKRIGGSKSGLMLLQRSF